MKPALQIINSIKEQLTYLGWMIDDICWYVERAIPTALIAGQFGAALSFWYFFYGINPQIDLIILMNVGIAVNRLFRKR